MGVYGFKSKRKVLFYATLKEDVTPIYTTFKKGTEMGVIAVTESKKGNGEIYSTLGWGKINAKHFNKI
jgi:hypothetical protein